MYLECFHYGFHEICDTPQYLTREEVELCLPEAINMEGYKLTPDRTPSIVSISNNINIMCEYYACMC